VKTALELGWSTYGGLSGGVMFSSSGPKRVPFTKAVILHILAGAGDDGSLKTVMLR